MNERCIHLLDTEATRVPISGGAETHFAGHLCDWADANPDRLMDAPRWLSGIALASMLITPERDCLGCPAFKLRSPLPRERE
jgi:hypothetical protein